VKQYAREERVVFTNRKARFAMAARIKGTATLAHDAKKQEKSKKCEKVYIVCEMLYNTGL
jgi:hypothetical protein